MSSDGQHQTQERLALRSQLTAIAQAATWVESLAPRYGIPENVRLAIRLCLEEVLTNIVVHGYRQEPNGPIVLRLCMPRTDFAVFIVEDEAPQFDPLGTSELPSLNPSQSMRVGGQGIRFLRRFADSLDYEATPAGNRLQIGFSLTSSAKSAN